MSRRFKLIFYSISISVLIIVSRIILGSFDFLFRDFWFISGLFLVLLVSLVDQPHFSTDSNVFTNASVGLMSLVAFPEGKRDWVWWLFAAWVVYLLGSSLFVIWKRSRQLREETLAIQTIARFNRIVGRPEAIFSAFFLWGLVIQFTARSDTFYVLLTFWFLFITLNFPAIGRVLEKLCSIGPMEEGEFRCDTISITHPNVLAFRTYSMAGSILGKTVFLKAGSKTLAKGVVIDDRHLAGIRIGQVALANHWTFSGIESVVIEIISTESESAAVGYVGQGSSIPAVVCEINPSFDLQLGEVLWAPYKGTEKAFYQITAANVIGSPSEDANHLHKIRVAATQLGRWNATNAHFEPCEWLPVPGTLISRSRAGRDYKSEIPASNLHLGDVPNSNFPVHAHVEQLITHNTAIIGVTGSGKSYLAANIVRDIIRRNIKVLILDITRQHITFLQDLTPFQLETPQGVKTWLASDQSVAIHQYATGENYTYVTKLIVENAFDLISKQVKLKAGENEPARLCIVFEEAHSLIPEWNQVAQKSDSDNVNRTASCILQGRKFGMGSIVITQRTANVTKTILNQCNTIFALRSFDQTGLDFLRNYMGSDFSETISTLPNYHAILVGMASSSRHPIHFQVSKPQSLIEIEGRNENGV